VTVTSKTNQPASIEIYDITGKNVIKTCFIGNKLNIYISRISNGIYFMKFVDSNKTETLKFIKSK
jgi:hypothetical protein